jgi:hypothetical protein
VIRPAKELVLLTTHMPTSSKTEQRSTDKSDAREPQGPEDRPFGRPFVAWLKGLPKKLGLLALAVLITLAVLEGVFRLAGYHPPYDTYSKPEAFWARDRALGWRLKPGTHDEFVGPALYPVEFRTSIRVNSLGLRGAEITGVPSGGRRVVVMGDSQAAGFEVRERDTYEALLQKRLTVALGVPVQVINAGVRGYGTDQELLMYERTIRQLHPDIVALHLSGNDPDDNTTLHRAGRLFSKPAFAVRPGGSLRLVGTPVPNYSLCSEYGLDDSFRVQRFDSLPSRSVCWVESRVTNRSALLSFLTTQVHTHPRLFGWFPSYGNPGQQEAAEPRKPAPAKTPEGGPARVQRTDFRNTLTSRLILQLASKVNQDGAQFVLVTQDGDIADLDLGAFEQAGINIVRIDQALGTNQDAVRFPHDGHLNARGHRAVASSLESPLRYLLAR